MAKTKKKSSFRGIVATNAKRGKSAGSSYGYLNLPRGANIYNPEPGSRARFDILPYEVTDPKHPDRDDELGSAIPGNLWYKRPFKTHRNIGANNDSVICLTSVSKRCPICEYRAQQIKDGADREITDALKISQRNLYVVCPQKDKKFDDVPHIWDISQYLFQNLLTDELEEDENYEIFPDLEEGLTLRVRFDSSSIGGGKPFAETSRIDFEERDKPYDDSILDDVPNLDEILNVLSASVLERKFFEMEEDEDVKPGEDDIPEDIVDKDVDTKKDEKAAPPTRKKKALKKKEEEEEEEEDDDPDACVACQGTGKDSKGKTCRPCRGTGKKIAKTKPAEEDKCPHGYRFGVECEDHDACFECDLWDQCMDKKEAHE